MSRALCSLVLLFPLLTGCLAFHKWPMPGEPHGAPFADVDGVRVRFTDTGEPDASASVMPQKPALETSATTSPEPSASAANAANAKPAVVLVHGFASAIEAWAGVVPALSKTHRVIALDLKGFDWTDRPEGDYSPEAQALLVLNVRPPM